MEEEGSDGEWERELEWERDINDEKADAVVRGAMQMVEQMQKEALMEDSDLPEGFKGLKTSDLAKDFIKNYVKDDMSGDAFGHVSSFV